MNKRLQTKTVDLRSLEIQAEQADFATWHGRQALRLENGLALAPAKMQCEDLCLQVSIAAEGPAYPGLVFRLAKPDNYELAYAVPHASGLWDAIQYDPIFLGSNTWQVYHGAAYQTTAQVPLGEWFDLQVQTVGLRAAISVNEQAPLVVERLAHPLQPGRFGLWTFRPAYFCDLSVSNSPDVKLPSGISPSAPPGALQMWRLERYGPVTCEPNGVLNLNRYLKPDQSPALLTRQFELSNDEQIEFQFGFSDVLTLKMDGKVIFQGERGFTGFADRAQRGYAEAGDYKIKQFLPAGRHSLSAQLSLKEPFGWGLILAVQAGDLQWLPADLDS